MANIDMYGKSIREWIYGVTRTCILLFLFIMQTLKFFTVFFITFCLFMFPFCLHATSVLYKLITVFFCIIKNFWIFDMFLNFLYVLNVNNNKFYCNTWFYLIAKRLYSWCDLVQFGTLWHSLPYSILGHLREMVLPCKWMVILVFYCLVIFCVILNCSVCLYLFLL